MTAAVTFSPASQCGRKHGYSSKQRAKKMARITETKFGGGRVEAYRCSWCSADGYTIWHVGHRPRADAIATRRHVGSEA